MSLVLSVAINVYQYISYQNESELEIQRKIQHENETLDGIKNLDDLEFNTLFASVFPSLQSEYQNSRELFDTSDGQDCTDFE